MVDPCWVQVRGPLEPYADGFRGELERLGYTPLSAAGHVRLVAHLNRWMTGRPVGVDVGTDDGGRLLRRAPSGRLLQLADGPFVAAAAG
jgi:hypothetical protein